MRHVRMLVPEGGDPTTKIGLFVLRCIQAPTDYSPFSEQSSLSVLTVAALVMLPIVKDCHDGKWQKN
jgi:hypothetical protein